MTNPRSLRERSARKAKGRAMIGQESNPSTTRSVKRGMTIPKSPKVIEFLAADLKQTDMVRACKLLAQRTMTFPNKIIKRTLNKRWFREVSARQQCFDEADELLNTYDARTVTKPQSAVKVLKAEHVLVVSDEAIVSNRSTEETLSRFSGRIVPDRSKVKTVAPETLDEYAYQRTNYYLEKFGGK